MNAGTRAETRQGSFASCPRPKQSTALSGLVVCSWYSFIKLCCDLNPIKYEDLWPTLARKHHRLHHVVFHQCSPQMRWMCSYSGLTPAQTQGSQMSSCCLSGACRHRHCPWWMIYISGELREAGVSVPPMTSAATPKYVHTHMRHCFRHP